MEYFSDFWPLGRPKCEHKTTDLAPLSKAYLMVGKAASMRAVFVMMLGSFLSCGTLKSTRMKTRLPFKSNWSIFFFASALRATTGTTLALGAAALLRLAVLAARTAARPRPAVATAPHRPKDGEAPEGWAAAKNCCEAAPATTLSTFLPWEGVATKLLTEFTAAVAATAAPATTHNLRDMMRASGGPSKADALQNLCGWAKP
mmetsp:Transcript_2842/g.6832  ORF Transcript_2842/g.6832 Transcript_2842/m.6832 type:complete len:202 (-) Transcript_2842:17-622(-)